jgi:hypothetical protein
VNKDLKIYTIKDVMITQKYAIRDLSKYQSLGKSRKIQSKRAVEVIPQAAKATVEKKGPGIQSIPTFMNPTKASKRMRTNK